MRRRIPGLLVMLLSTLVGVQARAAGGLEYVAGLRALPAGVTVVDARALAACQARSLRGARCLPAADFLGPHGRLASFRQIFWMLGTAGLSGAEHVLVVGDDPTERDFVAGMLYLCGQREVSVLTRAVSGGAGLDAEALGPGTPRATVRNAVFQEAVRGEAIVLRTELSHLFGGAAAPALLDGRSDAEYWGERIRSWRGGHLPGAQSLPMDVARAALAAGRLELPAGKRYVAYGHDAFESVAYFTLLRAGTGRAVRVLVDGWADWANHPSLPVDAETFPELQAPAAAPALPPATRWMLALGLFNLLALAVLAGGLAYTWKRKA